MVVRYRYTTHKVALVYAAHRVLYAEYETFPFNISFLYDIGQIVLAIPLHYQSSICERMYFFLFSRRNWRVTGGYHRMMQDQPSYTALQVAIMN